MELYFDKNDLFNVKITNKINTNDIFYESVYLKAATQIEHILGNCVIDNKNVRDFDNIENPNNILGFIGDRGQGKTSAMLTFKNFLMERNTELFGNYISQYNFQEIGVVDPSTFEEFSNLINIILARMYKCFKDEFEKRVVSGIPTRELKEKKIILLKNFQESYKYLSLITNKGKHSSDDDFYEQALENLSIIGDTSNFKKILSNLINSYLNFMNNGKPNSVLVLTIDDLDLDIRHSYSIVEQIRKYLIVPNLVILIAVKIQQLHRGIRTEYAKHLGNDVKDEAYHMATTYLRKMLPESRRIFMPRLCNDMGNLINDLTVVLNENVRVNFQEILCDLLYSKTNIIILSFGKRKKYLYSGNLRELIELYSLLLDLKDPSYYKGEEKYEVYQDNIDKFKEYFVYNWCATNLNQEEAGYIKEINKYSIYMKNRKVLKIIQKIYNKSGINTAHLDNLFEQKGTIDQFYALADVYDSLVDFKNSDYKLNIEHNGKFIYAIQTFYSIIMNQLLVIDKINLIKKKKSIHLEDNKIMRLNESDNINYISQFIGCEVMGTHYDNKVPLLDEHKSNVGDLILQRDFEKNSFNAIDLYMALVANKHFESKNMRVYSHNGWSKLKYSYDFSNIFFRGLDLDYTCLIFHKLNCNTEEKGMIRISESIYVLIEESDVYRKYKKSIESISRYILCNYDVYAFYNQWMINHVVNIPFENESYLTSYVNLISSFLGNLESDIKNYFYYESQKTILDDIRRTRAFLGEVVKESKNTLYFPDNVIVK